jgi:hypothetical protein
MIKDLRNSIGPSDGDGSSKLILRPSKNLGSEFSEEMMVLSERKE